MLLLLSPSIWSGTPAYGVLYCSSQECPEVILEQFLSNLWVTTWGLNEPFTGVTEEPQKTQMFSLHFITVANSQL